jgi:hypothetical protein
MPKERKEDHPESTDESQEREVLRQVFEGICDSTREGFLRDGSLEPRLIVLTRMGLAVIDINFEEGFDRELVARSIGETIRRTPVIVDDEPTYDEPMAVILAAEAWMVEYDPEEAETMQEMPPRLHPRRQEILQVTLRSRGVSFSRNWPIVREEDSVSLGASNDLGAEGMESVWDLIFTE